MRGWTSGNVCEYVDLQPAEEKAEEMGMAAARHAARTHDPDTNLQDLLAHNLRQGDVITRCSVSQFILMLPQANYENSCMVCQRIIRAFFRQYPHSPADIHFSVQPLEPMTPDFMPTTQA